MLYGEIDCHMTDKMALSIRCSSRIRHHACHPFAHCLPLRDHPIVGPIAFAPNISVPGETDPAEDYGVAFLPSDSIRVDDQLSTVQQGSPALSS